MINLFTYGNPFETEAVVDATSIVRGIDGTNILPVGNIDTENGFIWQYDMADTDIVYGLGESIRGINKRGWIYDSFATDDPHHTECKTALYAAHNFIIISGSNSPFGLFFDFPGKITFDIGYTNSSILKVSCEKADIKIYYLQGETETDIVSAFRKAIGRSYIPPKFAFGFGQSRWGYKTAEDFKEVVRKHRDAHIPMDMIYMDIDYMDNYKDFTFNPSEFSDFEGFVKELKAMKVHPVPIIDAGVKIEKGYSVYEEGVANNYFVKREDGSDFEACVWPGMTHFPDFLNENAREWFGNNYEILLSKGVDGFWNDMNEPAIFYTQEGYEEAVSLLKDFTEGKTENLKLNELGYSIIKYSNRAADFENFYHNVNGQKIKHFDVHNLYGYNMTRAAGEAFERLSPDKRILMFSRSSYIGMHRYGGVWTGDNKSWWSHILLNLKQLPGLSMCGFLYSGADCGGFGEDATRDLVLRWTALSVFTPLMRNHSCDGTRYQEFYQFEGAEDFRAVIEARYRLLPFIYSEFMKAVLNDEMLFKPLGFVYREDNIAKETEDQLIMGHDIMIAPVYTQNSSGRTVYLPEEMMLIKLLPDNQLYSEILPAGLHYVKIALNEVPLFIRKGHRIPITAPAECVDEIDYSTIQYVGYDNAEYELYNDDGVSRI